MVYILDWNMNIITYHVDFFKNKSFEEQIVLSDETKLIVDQLVKDLIIPFDIDPPPSLYRVDSDRKLRRTHSGGRRGLSKHGSKGSFGNLKEDWEAVRNFKATKMDEKEGVEKHISTMRGLLNKLSPKNYDTQKVLIMTTLEEILSEINGQEEEGLLFESMFKIMSTNSFLSNVYADLYVELVGAYDAFETLVDDFVESYKSQLHDIHYIDPNSDYDGFCEYNKKNDQRKCYAKFIVNLMKQDMISHDHVLEMIMLLQTMVEKYIDEEGRENEVEELSDNIVLFVMETKSVLENNELWISSIVPKIHTCMNLVVKDHVSFTSRAKFKYMECKL